MGIGLFSVDAFSNSIVSFCIIYGQSNALLTCLHSKHLPFQSDFKIGRFNRF